MKRLIPLLALLVWLVTGREALAIYDLSATRESAGRIPVGILGVTGAAGADSQVLEVNQVFMADLRRSALFHARDLGMRMAEPPEEALGPLQLREIAGSEAVEVMLWVRLEREGARWVLTGHIYDGARGRLTLGKRFVGKEDQLRQMVHRFVGELIHQFTGEYGITRSRIAFVSDLSGSKEIYVMEHDGGAPTRVTADRGISLTPSLSPDAEKVLYASQKSGGWVIYERELASGKSVVSLSAAGLNVAPDWNPQGDGYAVTASLDGNREIYHVAKGRKLRRLTHSTADDVSPAWSPDGQQIAFTSDQAGSPQIYVMGAKGGQARRLTFRGRYNSEPDWSPRGGLIAYTCQDGGFFHVCVMDANGGNPRQLTAGSWDDETPTFSPDGRHIAFSSSRGGKRDIYMMDLDGGGAERLTFNGANNTNPSWAGPTGR